MLSSSECNNLTAAKFHLTTHFVHCKIAVLFFTSTCAVNYALHYNHFCFNKQCFLCKLGEKWQHSLLYLLIYFPFPVLFISSCRSEFFHLVLFSFSLRTILSFSFYVFIRKMSLFYPYSWRIFLLVIEFWVDSFPLFFLAL